MIWEHSAGIIPFYIQSGKRKYLLLQSSLTTSEVWEFPKGLIEKGEDAQTTAMREFQEETGITEAEVIPGFKQTLRYFYRRKDQLIAKTVTYFLARTKSMEVRLSPESKDYEWVTFRQAQEKIKYKNVLELLQEADQYLNSIGSFQRKRIK